MSDTIRVLRVLEYTGPRDKVEDQVARSVHGEKRLPNGVTIKAATVGAYPELLEGLPVSEGFPGAPPLTKMVNTSQCNICGHPQHENSLCVFCRCDLRPSR